MNARILRGQRDFRLMRDDDRVIRVEWGLVVLGLVAFFAVLPHRLGYDGTTRFADIEALLHHGTLSDSKFSLVMPLASAPLLLVGDVVGSPRWWALHFNVIVVAIAILVAARLLRGHPREGLFTKSVLVLLFASYLGNRLWDYNAEVFTAALVGVGIVAVETGRARRRGWWAIVVGAANTPAAIVGVAFLSAREAIETRRVRRLWPVLAASALVMAEAWIRRGSPFDTGYANDHGYRNVLPYSGRPGFSYPFLFGALSILFSFGRGLVFFMPGLLFWLDSRTRFRFEGRTRSIVVAMLVFTVGLVVVYAKWWAWYGGTATGPRFFLLASVPASILLADRLRQLGRGAVAGALTLAVLVLSTWVAVIGVLAGPAPPEVCTRDRFAHEPLCLYTPELSPLGHPLVSFPHLAPRTSLVALLCVGASAYLAAPVVEQVFSRIRALQPRDLLKGWSV